MPIELTGDQSFETLEPALDVLELRDSAGSSNSLLVVRPLDAAEFHFRTGPEANAGFVILPEARARDICRVLANGEIEEFDGRLGILTVARGVVSTDGGCQVALGARDRRRLASMLLARQTRRNATRLAYFGRSDSDTGGASRVVNLCLTTLHGDHLAWIRTGFISDYWCLVNANYLRRAMENSNARVVDAMGPRRAATRPYVLVSEAGDGSDTRVSASCGTEVILAPGERAQMHAALVAHTESGTEQADAHEMLAAMNAGLTGRQPFVTPGPVLDALELDDSTAERPLSLLMVRTEDGIYLRTSHTRQSGIGAWTAVGRQSAQRLAAALVESNTVWTTEHHRSIGVYSNGMIGAGPNSSTVVLTDYQRRVASMWLHRALDIQRETEDITPEAAPWLRIRRDRSPETAWQYVWITVDRDRPDGTRDAPGTAQSRWIRVNTELFRRKLLAIATGPERLHSADTLMAYLRMDRTDGPPSATTGGAPGEIGAVFLTSELAEHISSALEARPRERSDLSGVIANAWMRSSLIDSWERLFSAPQAFGSQWRTEPDPRHREHPDRRPELQTHQTGAINTADSTLLLDCESTTGKKVRVRLEFVGREDRLIFAVEAEGMTTRASSAMELWDDTVSQVRAALGSSGGTPYESERLRLRHSRQTGATRISVGSRTSLWAHLSPEQAQAADEAISSRQQRSLQDRIPEPADCTGLAPEDT